MGCVFPKVWNPLRGMKMPQGTSINIKFRWKNLRFISLVSVKGMAVSLDIRITSSGYTDRLRERFHSIHSLAKNVRSKRKREKTFFPRVFDVMKMSVAHVLTLTSHHWIFRCEPPCPSLHMVSLCSVLAIRVVFCFFPPVFFFIF